MKTQHFPTLSDPFPTPIRPQHVSFFFALVLHWLIRDAQGPHQEQPKQGMPNPTLEGLLSNLSDSQMLCFL